MGDLLPTIPIQTFCDDLFTAVPENFYGYTMIFSFQVFKIRCTQVNIFYLMQIMKLVIHVQIN